MDEGPVGVGVSGLLMGFTALVALLDAKGLLDGGELSDILDRGSSDMSPDVAAEMRELANVLRGPRPPQLRPIDGGKQDDPEDQVGG